MNKTLIIVLFVLGLLTSCSNEDKNLLSSSGNFPGVTSVWISSGQIVKSTRVVPDPIQSKALRFEDEDALHRYCDALETVEPAARIEMSLELGVTSLAYIEDHANNELDSVATNACSVDEFQTLYDRLAKKYDGVLLRNYLDETDVTFYASEGDSELKNIKYIVNGNGEFVVGNKVRSIDLNILPQIVQTLSTDNASDMEDIPVNVVEFHPAKDKKVKFKIEKKGKDVAVSMWVKKRNWGRWRGDKYRWLLFEPVLLNYTPSFSPTDNIFWYYGYTDVYQKIGEALTSPVPSVVPPKITGKVYIWTDYAFDFDNKGNPIYDFPNSYGHPIVKRERAVVVNVNL